MDLICPVCGSSEVKTETVERALSVPYGPSATINEVVHTCTTCGAAADFTGANRGLVRAALEKCEAASAHQMLIELGEQGVTCAYFERALRLPARTTGRWKAGDLSAAPLALLRLIRTFPWLLEVADSNFDPGVVASKVLEEASRIVTSALHQTVVNHGGGTATFGVHFQVSESIRPAVTLTPMVEAFTTTFPGAPTLAEAVI